MGELGREGWEDGAQVGRYRWVVLMEGKGMEKPSGSRKAAGDGQAEEGRAGGGKLPWVGGLRGRVCGWLLTVGCLQCHYDVRGGITRC